MPIVQSRRRFLAGLSAAGAAGLVLTREIASRGAAAGNDHRPSAAVDRRRLLLGRPRTSPASYCARRLH